MVTSLKQLNEQIQKEQKRIEEEIKEDHRAESIPQNAISNIKKKFNKILNMKKTETIQVKITTETLVNKDYSPSIEDILDSEGMEDDFEFYTEIKKISGDITDLHELQDLLNEDGCDADLNRKQIKLSLLEIKQDILNLSKLYNVSPTKIVNKLS